MSNLNDHMHDDKYKGVVTAQKMKIKHREGDKVDAAIVTVTSDFPLETQTSTN